MIASTVGEELDESVQIETFLRLVESQPAVFIIGSGLVAFIIGGLLWLAVKAISDAGKVQPPLVVVVLVLGIVLLLLIVAIALRPALAESTLPVIGAGVGGLAGAVSQAFTARKKDSAYAPIESDGGM